MSLDDSHLDVHPIDYGKGKPWTSNINLWLDDIRPPWRHGCLGWTWAKTADEAIEILATGRVHNCSLDHDLSVDDTMGFPSGEKTGYDVIRWMEKNNIWPSGFINVHSMNQMGRARMQVVIDKHRNKGGKIYDAHK